MNEKNEQPVVKSSFNHYKIRTMKGVVVTVPSHKCEYMKPVLKHTFKSKGGKNVMVEEGFKHGQPVGDVLITRNFFGITPADFGGKVIATVEVIIKTNGNDKFVMLNITKEPEGAEINYRLVPRKERAPGAGDIAVPNTCMFLHFQPIAPKPKQEAQTPATDQQLQAT